MLFDETFKMVLEAIDADSELLPKSEADALNVRLKQKRIDSQESQKKREEEEQEEKYTRRERELEENEIKEKKLIGEIKEVLKKCNIPIEDKVFVKGRTIHDANTSLYKDSDRWINLDLDDGTGDITVNDYEISSQSIIALVESHLFSEFKILSYNGAEHKLIIIRFKL